MGVMKSLLVLSIVSSLLVSWVTPQAALAYGNKPKPFQGTITYFVNGQTAEANTSQETNNHCISGLFGAATTPFSDSPTITEQLKRLIVLDPKASLRLDVQASVSTQAPAKQGRLQARVIYAVQQGESVKELARTPVIQLEAGDLSMSGPDCSSISTLDLAPTAEKVTAAALAAVQFNQAALALRSLDPQTLTIATRTIDGQAVQSIMSAFRNPKRFVR